MQIPIDMNKQTALAARLIIPSLLFCLISSSCSSGGKLVSISEQRLGQAQKTNYLNWKTGSGSWSFVGGGSSTGSGFVQNFARYARSLPFPLVMWASDSKRDPGIFNSPSHQSYFEALRRIGAWAGPYQTKIYPGFIEIAWTDKENEKIIRDSMNENVPPIVFQSRNAADFLWMWKAVSGMEFKYDPGLIEDSLRYDAKRVLAESDPDLLLEELPQQPLPLGFTQFRSFRNQDVSDFMHELAAHIGGLARNTLHGWVIEKFQRNYQGLKLIEDCISQLKEGPPWEASKPIEILSRIGAPALPELLREFKPIRIDRDIRKQLPHSGRPEYLNPRLENNLIAVLSRIESPERDKALLDALKDRRSSIPNIISALAASNCQAAVQPIEEIAKTPDFEERTRLAARLALNALGRPFLAPKQEKIPGIINSSVQKTIEIGKGKEVITLLGAVLNQCDRYEPGMQIHSYAVDSSNETIVRGRFSRNSHAGPWTPWTFEVHVLREDRALIRFSYICGSLCGEGYLGRLKKQNGRWLVTSWNLLWMS